MLETSPHMVCHAHHECRLGVEHEDTSQQADNHQPQTRAQPQAARGSAWGNAGVHSGSVRPVRLGGNRLALYGGFFNRQID